VKNLLRNVAYASIMIAATTLTIHNLNKPAQAQIPAGTIIGYSTSGCSWHNVMLSNGDVYARTGNCASFDSSPAVYVGNFFDNQPTPTSPTTWSAIKSRFGDQK
jgi:hypothetical protein